MNIHPDLSDDDLSTAMGIETLLAHDLVPEGLPACSTGLAEQQIHHIGGRARYLVVNQSANRRHNSMVSKISQDGMELRGLGVLASVVEAWWNNGLIKRPYMRAICILLVYSTSKSTYLYSITSNFLIRQVYHQAVQASHVNTSQRSRHRRPACCDHCS